MLMRQTILTHKLWIILRQSVHQNGTFNASAIKIEWNNHKQSTFNSQGNVLSTILLAKYLFRFQNYVNDIRVQRYNSIELSEDSFPVDDLFENSTIGVFPDLIYLFWHVHMVFQLPRVNIRQGCRTRCCRIII